MAKGISIIILRITPKSSKGDFFDCAEAKCHLRDLGVISLIKVKNEK